MEWIAIIFLLVSMTVIGWVLYATAKQKQREAEGKTRDAEKWDKINKSAPIDDPIDRM